MARPKLSKLELQILEALWAQGKASIREIQEAFPEPRPAYTTIQTTVYRLARKKAVRRVREILRRVLGVDQRRWSVGMGVCRESDRGAHRAGALTRDGARRAAVLRRISNGKGQA